MNRALAWMIAAVLLGIGLSVWILRDRPEPAVVLPTDERTSASTTAPGQVAALPVEPTESGASERSEIEPAIPPATTIESKIEGDGLAELRGRFVLPGGAPAVGVKLAVRGWGGNNERLMKHGKPELWTDPQGTTDADGRFSFRFDPPLAYQFMLDAQASGYAKVSWRWSSLPPREVTDVGEIVLARAGSIRGRIVDAKGAPVGGNWMVYVDSSYQPGGEGGDKSRSHAPADTQTSEFLLEGVPPGPAQVKAHSQIANWIDGPSVVVESGEVAEADIVYTGPDNSRRIVVIPSCRPFHVFSNPAEGSIVLSGPLGERAAKQIEGSSQSWSFDDLDAGSYSVEVRDPRYMPWSMSGVTPGQSVRAQLTGSSSVALTVLDPAGVPVEDYRLRLQFRNVNFSPNEFEVRGKGAALPNGGVYSGLIPSDCTLRIDAEGYSTCEVVVDALAARETRALTAQLSRGATLGGVVVDGTTRAPIANAKVELSPHVEAAGDPADPSRAMPVMQVRFGNDPQVKECRTDARGRFEFTRVAAGTYSLRAMVNMHVHATIEPLAIGATGELVEIAVPASGSIAGRLIGPEGSTFDGLEISVTPSGNDEDPYAHFARLRYRDMPLGSLAPDGGYTLGPLPVGPFQVELVFPGKMVPTSFSSSMGLPEFRHVLGSVEVEAGKQLTRDFDLRDAFPGHLRVNVRVGGAPGSSLVVVAEASSSDEAEEAAQQAAGQTDATGRAVLGPMLHGDWIVTVRPVDSSWQWTSPAAVRVAPNATPEFDVDITLAEGTLQVLAEDDGKPLANRTVLVIGDGDAMHGVRSDAEGRVRLIHPIGLIAIADGGEPDDFAFFEPVSVQVDWTANGPVPATVRVQRAAKQ